MKTISISRIYPLFAAACLAFVLGGCATTTKTVGNLPEVPAKHTVAEISDDSPLRADDSWQGFNRSMYNFNYRFDKYVFLPVVRGYEFILPDVAQKGVSNFYNNLGEIRNFYNSLLQGKGGQALTTVGRFVTNTTIGIGGLFDPATGLGMKERKEDFGITMNTWGVSPGPYVVVPVLGPNSVRSFAGSLVDGSVRNEILDSGTGLSDGEINSVNLLDAVDTRHNQAFRYYQSGYPFEYNMVRFLYLQKREILAIK